MSDGKDHPDGGDRGGHPAGAGKALRRPDRTYQSAKIAAEGRDYVTSLDTKAATSGQCAVVIRMARLLEDYAARRYGFQNINRVKAGGVITAHGGPSAFGAAGFKKNSPVQCGQLYDSVCQPGKGCVPTYQHL